MSVIKSYGEFWNPELVEWGKQGKGNKARLVGNARPDDKKKNEYEVDMWEATAIYVLLSNFSPVYIGKAEKSLGPRLKSHRQDHKQGRWDLFSFYSLSYPKKDGKASNAGQRQLTAKQVVTAFEAVAIRAFDPPLNRKHESFKGGVPIYQIGEIETVRGALHAINQKI